MPEVRQGEPQAGGRSPPALQGGVTVVCVKWGTAFGPQYVHRLYDGLRRNTSQPFRFLCFTDDPSEIRPDIECRPLVRGELVGWWHKSWLFSDECGLTGPVVYYDLDTVIVGNVDAHLEWRGDFIVAANPASRAKNPRARNIGAMLMGWQGGFQYGRETWRRVQEGGPDLYGNQAHTGDQRLMMQHPPEGGFRYWQDECPEVGVISYKAHMVAGRRTEEVPEGTGVVCFHGLPRPHEVSDLPWMRQHWREGA